MKRKNLMMLLAGAVFCAGVGFAEEPVAYLDWDGEEISVKRDEGEIVVVGSCSRRGELGMR